MILYICTVLDLLKLPEAVSSSEEPGWCEQCCATCVTVLAIGPQSFKGQHPGPSSLL